VLDQRRIGQIAVTTPLWFLAVYLALSAIYPEYSHKTKAISELGALGAPHKWVWNVFGYILPGLAVAILGIGLRREISFSGRAGGVPFWALIASGILMSASGVFPGDFENRTSTTMILHAVGSFGSFLAFLIAGFWLPVRFRRLQNWRWLVWPSLLLVVGSIVTGFLRTGSAPGIGQRLGFACFFAWVGLVGFALIRSQRRAAAA